MASDSIRGHMLAESLPYTTEHRLLAEIKALTVELLHETKRQNALSTQQAELDR